MHFGLEKQTEDLLSNMTSGWKCSNLHNTQHLWHLTPTLSRPLFLLLVLFVAGCTSDGDAFTSSAVIQELMLQEAVIVQKVQDYLTAEESRLNGIRE